MSLLRLGWGSGPLQYRSEKLRQQEILGAPPISVPSRSAKVTFAAYSTCASRITASHFSRISVPTSNGSPCTNSARNNSTDNALAYCFSTNFLMMRTTRAIPSPGINLEVTGSLTLPKRSVQPGRAHTLLPYRVTM